MQLDQKIVDQETKLWQQEERVQTLQKDVHLKSTFLLDLDARVQTLQDENDLS